MAKRSASTTPPARKGRKIFGGLVPFDKEWRTGATTPRLRDDGRPNHWRHAVPAVSTSCTPVPGEKSWKLIINNRLGNGGTDYDEEAGPAPRDESGGTVPAVENFTISFHEMGKVAIFIWTGRPPGGGGDFREVVRLSGFQTSLVVPVVQRGIFYCSYPTNSTSPHFHRDIERKVQPMPTALRCVPRFPDRRVPGSDQRNVDNARLLLERAEFTMPKTRPTGDPVGFTRECDASCPKSRERKAGGGMACSTVSRS